MLNFKCFDDLRNSLNILGYEKYILPITGVPLVGALLEDLVKATENLRDSKENFMHFLQEGSCWQLGMEPYKCENTRLLTECNRLHQEAFKKNEEFQYFEAELKKRNRELENDNKRLLEQCQYLQKTKNFSNVNGNKQAIDPKLKFAKDKKTAVDSSISRHLANSVNCVENVKTSKCTKCFSGYYQHAMKKTKVNDENTAQKILELENNIKDLTEEIYAYKYKVEERDKEIQRLTKIVEGERLPPLLANNCCYKNLGKLNENIEFLKNEKNENLNKAQEYRKQMHEVMQQAIKNEVQNNQLRKEIDDLKKTALQVERLANEEIQFREIEIEKLRSKLFRICENNK